MCESYSGPAKSGPIKRLTLLSGVDSIYDATILTEWGTNLNSLAGRDWKLGCWGDVSSETDAFFPMYPLPPPTATGGGGGLEREGGGGNSWLRGGNRSCLGGGGPREGRAGRFSLEAGTDWVWEGKAEFVLLDPEDF